jgi:hypothetical protein
MSRNRGRSHVPGPVVEDVVAAVVARMTVRHPSVADAVVGDVVYQAAVELVCTVVDRDELRRQLERRVHARLLALTGAPVPITTARGNR